MGRDCTKRSLPIVLSWWLEFFQVFSQGYIKIVFRSEFRNNLAEIGGRAPKNIVFMTIFRQKLCDFDFILIPLHFKS